MSFSTRERDILLSQTGVGPTVIRRPEDAGITSFSALALASADELCHTIAHQLGSTCWRNNPQARAALVRAINAARHVIAGTEAEVTLVSKDFTPSPFPKKT